VSPRWARPVGLKKAGAIGRYSDLKDEIEWSASHWQLTKQHLTWIKSVWLKDGCAPEIRYGGKGHPAKAA